MFQGIYEHPADPADRSGNSQPDLLNVKAQRDPTGWHQHTHQQKQGHFDSDVCCVLISINNSFDVFFIAKS